MTSSIQTEQLANSESNSSLEPFPTSKISNNLNESIEPPTNFQPGEQPSKSPSRLSRSRSRSPSRGDEEFGRERSRSSRHRDRSSSRHKSGRGYDHEFERRRRERRDRDRDYDRYTRRHRDEHKSRHRRHSSPSPHKDVERDQRTVFVQQLAARIRTRELIDFFESNVGPVRDASIVKDKASGRSKGVAYVEFRKREDVAKAIGLTGEKLLGIPIIVQYTEAEKNRQKAEAANREYMKLQQNGDDNSHGLSSPKTAGNIRHGNGNNNINVNGGPPDSRIYVGNIHFGVAEPELQSIFGSFGEIQFVKLQRDPTGKSKGYAFIQ